MSTKYLDPSLHNLVKSTVVCFFFVDSSSLFPPQVKTRCILPLLCLLNQEKVLFGSIQVSVATFVIVWKGT